MERPLNRCEPCPCKKKTHTQTDGRTEAHAHAHAGNRANAQPRRDGGHAQTEGGGGGAAPAGGSPRPPGAAGSPESGEDASPERSEGARPPAPRFLTPGLELPANASRAPNIRILHPRALKKKKKAFCLWNALILKKITNTVCFFGL